LRRRPFSRDSGTRVAICRRRRQRHGEQAQIATPGRRDRVRDPVLRRAGFEGERSGRVPGAVRDSDRNAYYNRGYYNGGYYNGGYGYYGRPYHGRYRHGYRPYWMKRVYVRAPYPRWVYQRIYYPYPYAYTRPYAYCP
jgi:hypothetical protein